MPTAGLTSWRHCWTGTLPAKTWVHAKADYASLATPSVVRSLTSSSLVIIIKPDDSR